MEKVSLRVAEVKELWCKESFASAKSACWGDNRYTWYTEEQLSPVVTYRIKGEDGKTYLWATQKQPAVGDKINGFVKALKEYKGTQQIVITRCKIEA